MPVMSLKVTRREILTTSPLSSLHQTSLTLRGQTLRILTMTLRRPGFIPIRPTGKLCQGYPPPLNQVLRPRSVRMKGKITMRIQPKCVEVILV